MFNSVENSKRAHMSTNDYNSILSFKCDGCHLIKPHLRIFADKTEKGYLCDHCIKD